MQAEAPELSPVNWTSFYTAQGPEGHGVFGFFELDRRDYQLRLVDSSNVLCPTIFDRLARQGLLSKVINLPNTYPVQSFPGMIIAGFVAPRLERAVYPRFLVQPLREAGYTLEADTVRGKEDPDFLFGQLRKTLASREKALDLFWPDLAWDLFVFVLTETDRLGHFLFPALGDEHDPRHLDCLDFMRDWDRVLGGFLERYQALPEPKRLLVLADHGFTPLTTEVDINFWLRQRGYLRPLGRPAHELDATVIGPDSLAFALDPGRIYIHDQGRFARGGCPVEKVHLWRDRIRQGLMGLRHNGRPVLKAVHLGERLYPRSRSPFVPDLVCEPRLGYDLKAKFDRERLFGCYGRQGTHSRNHAFYYHSQGKRLKRVREVGQEVLAFFSELPLIKA
jgi:predicted AlkP superfamily phosphohydrolase/phosphomutase